jgi:hypothetical protein
MRKLVYTALLIVALGCFIGASAAYAGDCCKPKCHKSACNDCKPKCESCKSKCEPCHKPKCESCKPKCESKCNSCKPKCDSCHKPKCDSCEPKCEQDTCNSCNKCSPCKTKCNSCENKCNKCSPCKNKCNSCESKCDDGCGMCSGRSHHPYEDCFTGSSMLCDTGCCGTYIPCKRECVTCETVCKKVETVDPCTGCVTVEYVNETECHEVERPTVIPWWFNEKGPENIYVDDKKVEDKDEAKDEAKPEAEEGK